MISIISGNTSFAVFSAALLIFLAASAVYAIRHRSCKGISGKGAVLLILSVIVSVLLCVLSIIAPSDDGIDLYEAAMADAVFAEEDEILPLVTITADDPLVTWSEDNSSVLLLSWNRHPERYKEGEYITTGDIWTFTDKEILAWAREEGSGVEDWTLRLEQLIGLPENSRYTHVSFFFVSPDSVIRPAYVTDITSQISAESLDGSMLGEYESWFDSNILWSYFDSAYPWTRLGYTYDWSGEGEYGLTEFLITEGSKAYVAKTLTTDEFVDWLMAGGLESAV